METDAYVKFVLLGLAFAGVAIIAATVVGGAVLGMLVKAWLP